MVLPFLLPTRNQFMSRLPILLSALMLTSFHTSTDVTEVQTDLWCKHKNVRYRPPCYAPIKYPPLTPIVKLWLEQGSRLAEKE